MKKTLGFPQNNNRVKDIKDDDKEPENIFEGSVLPKLFWRWVFSEQKHIWEGIWNNTITESFLNHSSSFFGGGGSNFLFFYCDKYC